ncbi:hypothetical protein BD309DRAFT_487940 [Dichomitus squalens]|nr:hypothetical protein BD309DRAFT_487940 [Dichomitus squalens]
MYVKGNLLQTRCLSTKALKYLPVSADHGNCHICHTCRQNSPKHFCHIHYVQTAPAHHIGFLLAHSFRYQTQLSPKFLGLGLGLQTGKSPTYARSP